MKTTIRGILIGSCVRITRFHAAGATNAADEERSDHGSGGNHERGNERDGAPG